MATRIFTEIFASCIVVTAPHSGCEVISLAAIFSQEFQSFRYHSVVRGAQFSAGSHIYDLVTFCYVAFAPFAPVARLFAKIFTSFSVTSPAATTHYWVSWHFLVVPCQSPFGIYPRPGTKSFTICTTGCLRWSIACESLCLRNRCGLY